MSTRRISSPVNIGKGMMRITVTSKMIMRKLTNIDGVLIDDERVIFPYSILKSIMSAINKARKEQYKKCEDEE